MIADTTASPELVCADSDIPNLLNALRTQRQLDADGFEVGVSREAVDHAIALVVRLQHDNAALRGSLDHFETSAVLICPKCGVDRSKGICQQPYTGCPIIGITGEPNIHHSLNACMFRDACRTMSAELELRKTQKDVLLQRESDAHAMLDGDSVQKERHGDEGVLSLAERCECLINNKDNIEDELADTLSEVNTLSERIRQRDSILLFLLWHHQGGSSPVGQPIRKLYGIEPEAHLTDEQMAIAEAYAEGVKA